MSSKRYAERFGKHVRILVLPFKLVTFCQDQLPRPITLVFVYFLVSWQGVLILNNTRKGLLSVCHCSIILHRTSQASIWKSPVKRNDRRVLHFPLRATAPGNSSFDETLPSLFQYVFPLFTICYLLERRFLMTFLKRKLNLSDGLSQTPQIAK